MGTSNQLLQCLANAHPHGLDLDALDAAIPESARKSIVMAACLLSTRGLIDRPEPGRYRLTPAGLIALRDGAEIKPGSRGRRSPRRYALTLRVRAWRAMRALQKFSLDDLLLLAANGDEADARNNVTKYVRALEQAGYLVRLRQRSPGDAPTSNGFVRWLLVRNTGPRPPIWSPRRRCLFDPNTLETLWQDALDAAPVEEPAHA